MKLIKKITKWIIWGTAYTIIASFGIVMGSEIPNQNIDGKNLTHSELQEISNSLTDEVSILENDLKQIEMELIKNEEEFTLKTELIQLSDSIIASDLIKELESEVVSLNEKNTEEFNGMKAKLIAEDESIQKSINSTQNEINEMQAKIEKWGN